jgi:hypothetical protein
MPYYQAAHFREQNVDLIIVPVNWTMAAKPPAVRKEIIATLQSSATGAGLKGSVVPVWQSGKGMYFIAPEKWRPFFRSISYEFVQEKINTKFDCPDERVAMRSFVDPAIRTAQPNESTQLDEAILCASIEALETVSPELITHVDEIVSLKPVWSGGHEIGQSIHDRYEIKLPKATLDSIVGALKKIEAAHGYNKTFADRQINLLVLLWSRIVPSERPLPA